MKNKKKLFLLLLLVLFFNGKKAYSEPFNFEAIEIQIKDNGNILYAKDGVKITSDNGIKILANSFLYNKTNLTLLIEGNVKIFDNIHNLELFGEKFIYEKLNEKIFSENDINAIINKKYTLNAKELVYLISEQKVISNKESLLIDNLNNKIKTDKFYYLMNEGILKSMKFNYTEGSSGNNYFINSAILNIKSGEIIGGDLAIDFNKNSFGNSNNDPRLKGKTISINDNQTVVTKGIFTTCKKTGKCPPFTLSAKEVVHDKTKKRINYKNALLRLYDKPIFYFPKFFHPDPTVKRQSGFLIPSYQDSNTLGAHFSTPYFHVISDSKDLTIKPRFYSYNSILLNSEYRAVTKNSTHIIDTSLKKKVLKPKNNDSTKSHFFSNSKFDLDDFIFNENEIEVKIEQVSDDTYLKTYNIDSPIVNNTSILNSSITFNGFNEDLFFQTNFQVYENLSIENNNDRYEYILPNITIDKIINLDNDLNGSLSLNTSGYTKQYETNITETSLINNLNYNSYPAANIKGFLSDYKLILKNVNLDSKNSNKYKNKLESEILTAGMYTISYPLKMMDESFKKFLTPKMSFKYSPTKSKNMRTEDRRINIDNIYSFNRIQSNDTLEAGASVTLGSDYLITNKKDLDIFKFSLATVYRDETNNDLPIKSTLGNKSSNIFGSIGLKPSKYFNMEYNFSLENDLDRSNYDHIKAEITINNFVNSFEFLEENYGVSDHGYWSNKTTFNFSNKNSLSISRRRNTKTDLNEFYNLVYQYKNDCLKAAVEYNRDYYSDGDLTPNEQLFFSLTIVPFSTFNSPNVNK